MNRLSIFLLNIVLIVSCNSEKTSSTKEVYGTNDSSKYITDTIYTFGFGRNIYENLTPNQFLNHLLNYKVDSKVLNFLIYAKAPIVWIKQDDIDTLILRVFDTTKVRCIVNPLSSYIPDSSSCVGREAQNMIAAYIQKRSYLDFLYSFGQVDSVKAKELISWYKNWN